MGAQRWMWIAWPAFLLAAVLEMLVFAMVDPGDLHWFGQPLDWSRQAVYTVGFFVFWAITMATSALTAMVRATSTPAPVPSAADPATPRVPPLRVVPPE